MEDGSNNVITEIFADELNWCIRQLELGLQRQSPDSRQTQDSLKILKVLRSSKAPMVKKRQAMRNALGDYRKKMKDDEKKSLNAMKHSKFKLTHSKKFFGRSKFIRHSHTKEATFERENEENKLLSMNLNSLNLHQNLPGDLSSSSSTLTSSQAGSSHIPIGTDGSVYGCINIKAEDSTTLPKIDDLCTSRGNQFKFCPSDNSFSFNFTEDDREEVKHSDKSEVANNLESSQGFNISESDKFKYEKSDNSFSFGFNL